MDKADFTFIVASFLYMVLAIVERLGLMPDTLIIDFAFAFLWGTRSGGFAIRLR